MEWYCCSTWIRTKPQRRLALPGQRRVSLTLDRVVQALAGLELAATASWDYHFLDSNGVWWEPCMLSITLVTNLPGKQRVQNADTTST